MKQLINIKYYYDLFFKFACFQSVKTDGITKCFKKKYPRNIDLLGLDPDCLQMIKGYKQSGVYTCFGSSLSKIINSFPHSANFKVLFRLSGSSIFLFW